MVRRILSVAAAVLLAAGLFCALPAAAKTKKKPDPPRKTVSKKDAKRAERERKAAKERAAKKSKKDRKNDTRASRSRRVSKNDASAKRTVRSSKPVASTPDPGDGASRSRRTKNGGGSGEDASGVARTVPASSPVVRPTVVVPGGSDGGSGEFQDEPEGPPPPKPANRIVADISSARVIQIQNALIAQGLLTGPANGVYDQPTFDAMAAFQSRKGQRPVGVPTADSLKALGVPKTSGRTLMSPSRVLESTAPPEQ